MSAFAPRFEVSYSITVALTAIERARGFPDAATPMGRHEPTSAIHADAQARADGLGIQQAVVLVTIREAGVI